MFLRRLLTILMVAAFAALPCSLGRRTIWSKAKDSSSALFRVVVNGKAGYIDATGRMVIPPRFNPFYIDPSDGDFIDGRARVMGDIYIDETGREVKPPGPGRRLEITRVGRFSQGLADFTADNPVGFRSSFGYFRGYLNETGKIVIPAKFAWAGRFSSEGLAPVALNGRCWVAGFGVLGRLPAPSAPFMLTSCGPQPDLKGEEDVPCRHGYIDRSGNLVLPAIYELATEFSEGRAAVRRNGLWGFIDKAGRVVADFRYEEVRPFSEGRAAVKTARGWGYIDREGRMVLEPAWRYAESFQEGVAVVGEGESLQEANRYYIGLSGKSAGVGRFRQATGFVKGLAHVQLEATEWAWIDHKGKIVFRYQWDQTF